MQKLNNHRYIQAPITFKRVWSLASIALLLILLAYNWHHNQLSSQKHLQVQVQHAQDGLEELFYNLLQNIYSLPIYKGHLNKCPPPLRSALQKAIFTSPKISGIVISDNSKKIICSTLPKSLSVATTEGAQRTIFGPVLVPKMAPPFFLLQQRLGDYYIALYFLDSVLDETLKPYLSSENYLKIYNQSEQKTLAVLNSTNYHYPDSTLFAKSKVQVLDNIEIIFGISERQILNSFFISSLWLSLLFISFSIAFYFLFKRLINNRFSLQGHLKYALKYQGFFPVYQPIYNNSHQRFEGAEVLLRWKTIDGEIIMPELFIAEAEKTELILDITLKIVDIALADYATILKPTIPFYLSFNLSAHHFTSNTFFNNFIKLVEKHHLSPQNIMLELTERDIINKNHQVFHEKMQNLQRLGFSLAIDDFGTGHANISYLQQFPFDYLKIDKLFVQAIGTGSVTELLIDTIIRMAKTLNLSIIAEGIEEEKQARYLEINEVHYLQGWYYSKAITMTELRQLL